MAEDSNILSQDDIDSLLAEATGDDPEEEPQAEASGGAGPVEPDPPPEPSGAVDVPGVSPLPPQEQFTHQMPPAPIPPREIEFIMDIPLEVRVEVGRTRVTINNLLTYGPGAVIELDKLAGEPLDIYVNNKLVARGEAVVINEKFGVRLTDVVSKTERVETLV
jgi:flagellar motor switch protein FliN/FliY